jgi:hypothetical protein
MGGFKVGSGGPFYAFCRAGIFFLKKRGGERRENLPALFGSGKFFTLEKFHTKAKPLIAGDPKIVGRSKKSDFGELLKMFEFNPLRELS